jgi:hypothetical protein
MRIRTALSSTCLAAALLWIAVTLGVHPAGAADPSRLKLPPSKVTSLDLTNLVLTVDWSGTNTTVFITSQTRFFKDGKYAISKDLREGDEIRGTLKRTADDRFEAVRIFWGKPSPREK